MGCDGGCYAVGTVLEYRRHGRDASKCGGAELNKHWELQERPDGSVGLTGVEGAAAGAVLLAHCRWSDTGSWNLGQVRSRPGKNC